MTAPDFIYMDHNATTQPTEEVVAAMTASLRTGWHNPSSIHRLGQAARQKVELARASVAELLGCRDRDIIFTSGGTEADNLAVLGSLAAQPKRPLVVTDRREHAAVREVAEHLEEAGREVAWLDADDHGRIDLEAFERLLAARADEIAVVSLMWANNETGLIQDLEAVGTRCRAAGVRFHTDAVQWVGKMPTNFAELPVDLLSFSAHKFHGPKGIGGLVVGRGARVEPRSIGGPQERNRRGGTENVPGIVGMGVAARQAMEWLATANIAALEAERDAFEQRVRNVVPDVVVNHENAPRLWNTSNLGFPRLEAEALLLLLSERGVCASAGAACSSGSLDPSPVLLAGGIAAEVAHGSVRFSRSRDTTPNELDRVVEVIAAVVERLRASMPA